MALPISYNIRNLIERKTTALLTALGIALPVAILLVVLALVAGLQAAFQASGSPQHVLVLRKGTNAKRYPGLRLGSRVTFARGEWEVVGVLDGGQSALNSEIFGDLHQIASDYNRSDALSSVLIRAENPMAAQALIDDISSDVKLNL